MHEFLLKVFEHRVKKMSVGYKNSFSTKLSSESEVRGKWLIDTMSQINHHREICAQFEDQTNEPSAISTDRGVYWLSGKISKSCKLKQEGQDDLSTYASKINFW